MQDIEKFSFYKESFIREIVSVHPPPPPSSLLFLFIPFYLVSLFSSTRNNNNFYVLTARRGGGEREGKHTRERQSNQSRGGRGRGSEEVYTEYIFLPNERQFEIIHWSLVNAYVMIQQRGQITMALGARGPRSYHGTRFPGIPGFSGLSSQSHGALQRNRSMPRSVIRLGRGRRERERERKGWVAPKSFETRNRILPGKRV